MLWEKQTRKICRTLRSTQHMRDSTSNRTVWKILIFDFLHFSTFNYTIQGMVKYCNRGWKKGGFFAYFFRNISKTAEIILIKKIRRNHGISVYKKALISEHQKNYNFWDNNCFVKMSVSLYITKFLLTSLLKN